MVFNFDLSTDVGKLRAEIPDTVESNAVFSDEELEYYISKANNNIQWARVYALEAWCSLLSGNAGNECEIGDIMIKKSATSGQNVCDLAKRLRFEMQNGLDPASGYQPFFYAGGIYQNDRDSNDEAIADGTLTQRRFYNNYNDMDDSSENEEYGE